MIARNAPPLSERELTALFAAPDSARNAAMEKLLAQGTHALGIAWKLAQGADDALAASALSYLVKAVHKPKIRAALTELWPSRQPLHALLQNGNAKRRKNAARLIGALGDTRDEDALLAALETETTRYVRPSLTLALGSCGGEKALAVLRAYRPPGDVQPEDAKHVQAENEAVAAALTRLAPQKRHVLRALDTVYPLELRTLNGYAQVLIQEGRAQGISLQQLDSNRVRLQTRDYTLLEKLRTYTEALFPLVSDMPFTPQAVAEAVLTQRVPQRLLAMHGEEELFTYRVELRGVPHEARAPFARALSPLLPPSLVNAPSNYDFELRVEAAPPRCALYFKLYTAPDTRFAYRHKTVPAAMHPVTAASLLRAHQTLLRPDARVLDPCCGGGTLLIERALVSSCDTLTGVDIAQSAIDIARDSAANAGVDARFVRADILQFVVRKPYDEVIANLPFGLRVGTHNDNQRLYTLLVERLPTMLLDGGIALLVTAERVLLRRIVHEQKGMRLISESRIEAGGLAPSVFLLQKV